MHTGDALPDHRLDPNNPLRPLPEDSPQGTTIRRHVAAVGDNVLAILFSVLIAKQFPDSVFGLQVIAMVASYLGYYLIFEAVFCTTPGKYLTGLTIRNFDGGSCSFRQTLVRTVCRLVEVNPFVLGGLPAAASILWSRDKQRLGDKLARTVVVPR
ncbi:MAG TPA: hypothetical protein DEF45_10375 [Rhodopirellula sp.]|nr:hypothetical protein [Rhodopirellula sp.]